VVEFQRGRQAMVRFKVHPEQRDTRYVVSAEAPLCDRRSVKSSSGQVGVRPVVRTTIELMGERWELELTLVDRDEMGFRMLLGRQAVRTRFLVDPGRSFLNGRRVKGSRRLKKKKNRR
jgi:hypothetical protein